MTRLVALCMATALAAACRTDGRGDGMSTAPTVSARQWEAVAARRIVFGHQSVGSNILDGVRALAADSGVNLPITESRGPASAPGLTHFLVGRNGDPLGKIRDFSAVIDGGANGDIALLKLCYIDLGAGDEPRQLAATYCDTLDALAGRHPRTRFVAVTVPLTTVQGGPKALVKRLLGRIPDGWQENALRHAFNEALRVRYADGGRLFDLAALEAAPRPRSRDGRPVPALDPSLTDDGGHLNAAGARRVAAALIGFLAEVATEPGESAR